MYWYENLKPDYVYNNFTELMVKNPNIINDEALIFFINFDNGFGSNLTVIIQNSLYLKTINPKLHCLGHFSVNGINFKYHDLSYNNSFFLYFTYLKDIPINTKFYFIKLDVIDYPFIQPQNVDGMNVNDIQINNIYKNHFQENFRLKIGNEMADYINNIKCCDKKLLGLHIRSYAQILTLNKDPNNTIENRILKIKNEFDTKYKNYNIFLTTDVNNYIDKVKQIFMGTDVKIYYNELISRIDNHGDGITGALFGYNDSMSNMNKECIGFKLGSDIIYDCISLINCDYYYVSITNIAFMTSFFNDKNNGIHYN